MFGNPFVPYVVNLMRNKKFSAKDMQEWVTAMNDNDDLPYMKKFTQKYKLDNDDRNVLAMYEGHNNQPRMIMLPKMKKTADDTGAPGDAAGDAAKALETSREVLAEAKAKREARASALETSREVLAEAKAKREADAEIEARIARDMETIGDQPTREEIEQMNEAGHIDGKWADSLDNKYFAKYLKYKNKYEALKKSME